MNTIDIASRREVFVDNDLINKLSGTARLKMHPPMREEAVLHYETQSGNIRCWLKATDATCSFTTAIHFGSNRINNALMVVFCPHLVRS
jgi:hypothetical protein